MAQEVDPSSGLFCPQCISGNVRCRQTVKSVAVWFGAVALLVVLIAGTPYAGPSSSSPLLLVLFFMLFVAGIGAVMAPFSLAFGKNRCKDCGHKWR